MYEGFPPLRTQPKVAGSTRTFHDFMDSYQPWFEHEPLGSDGHLEVPAKSVTTGAGVFEVDRILDRRKRKKGFEYYVQWKGYDPDSSTWEPQRHLEDYGCRTLLHEFNLAYGKTHVQSKLCVARNDDPAGRTTCLYQAAQATLDADEQDKAEYESSQSRRGKRREWAIRANMVKKWQETSAAQWITSYATSLHPRPTPPVNTVSSHNGVQSDPDEPGGEVYETVKELTRVQHLEGDPLDFIPGYKKELENVTKMRLKEVSPAVAQYVRQKKLAVRLRMLLEVKRDMRR